MWDNEHQSESGKMTMPILAISPSTIERKALLEHFRGRIVHNVDLDRTLVSFQANKQVPFYGWFKYREGFSQQLVQYLLRTLMPKPGTLLDPFVGSGASLFAANELGWSAYGIEVLPVGLYAIQMRLIAERVNKESLRKLINDVLIINFADYYDSRFAFKHIAITNGAYPPQEERNLIGYISYCKQYVENSDLQTLLLYAAFCILEDLSYTRKDGQYLRWDARSGRSMGKKPFDKGIIYTFQELIAKKLNQIADDILGINIQRTLFDEPSAPTSYSREKLYSLAGSCLALLPTMPNRYFDFVLTSPPYANRYDYTRTYALELVYLDCDTDEVKRLRQLMLSCTVENKDKRTMIKQQYISLDRRSDFDLVNETFNKQAALQELLATLEVHRKDGKLNNPHIIRLVHNYFYEMAFVVYELTRLLKPGGIIAMVNDNVRYAGEEVPVDLILSDMAETFGLTVRAIWTLGRGKGNSSQQMGQHGRTELRKCIYIWEKLADDK